jgi:hypothetical protein
MLTVRVGRRPSLPPHIDYHIDPLLLLLLLLGDI